MNITGSTSCFPHESQRLDMYDVTEDDVVSSSVQVTSNSDPHSTSLLFNLSLLREKVHQVQSLSTIFISPDPTESTAMAIANTGTLIQEIIETASSMMFSCQQMALGATSGDNSIVHDWYGENDATCTKYDNSWNTIALGNNNEVETRELPQRVENNEGFSSKNYDIIELDASDILAKYTHYCQVCGKGFKRDANLRMHMRAHGDEYKSSAALVNPMKNGGAGNEDSFAKLPLKYSCPQEGCRWNKKHAKFQPLKSMICVKNHYKRSHCPKMYVCKRCNRKQFSVLSDLRTHEKHCGDLKWQCSCGTTFSRKDKLVGHVALFVGHTPAVTSLTKMANCAR